MEYKLIRSVSDMKDMSGSGVAPTVSGSGVAPTVYGSGVAPTMYASIPALGQPLANSPNPTLVTLPLKRESVLISGLHEFSVYQFTIYYENAVGRSDSSSPLEQATSAAGIMKCLMKWQNLIRMTCCYVDTIGNSNFVHYSKVSLTQRLLV